MDEIRIIDVKESILKENEEGADALRKRLREENTCLLNLMGSPGAGKTTLLEQTIERLKDKLKMAVMEADIDSAVDAERIRAAGAPVVQLHTGGMCHLDAGMTAEGLKALNTKDFDLIVLENVGNLVCPAEFDTGSTFNAAILSVPEGDDKPLKYPLMFQVANVVLVSKIDTMPYFDFNMDRFKEAALNRNPGLKIFPLSAKTGEGMEEWVNWLFKQCK